VDRDECPQLVRALSGGWRFELARKGDTQKPFPEKNSYSHFGDAFGYTARYFHKQFERGGERGVTIAHGVAMAQRLQPARVPRYNFS
jgi:hypothetical protein